MARFYIENFGCRATQADGAALERQFLERGLERAGAAREAEIVVLNTCTVTEGADKDARASIRRLQRVNPNCRILVTGCYAQRAPEELAAMPGVTWVVGNSHKHQAAEIATTPFAADGFVPIGELSGESDRPRKKLEPLSNIVVGDIFAHTELMAAPVFEAANERTRPNLKVQDGCDNRCSFCVIPYVRGQSRSLPAERVIAEVRTLVGAGYREVVISGINLGRWGRDLGGSSQLSAVSSEPVVSQQYVMLFSLLDFSVFYRRGLQAGANLVTINMTPDGMRDDYIIYKRDRFIMTEARVLAAIEAEGLTPSRQGLADYYRNRHGQPRHQGTRVRDQLRLAMASRILLINANRCCAPDPVFPLGLSHLNAALRRAGHETRLFDSSRNRSRSRKRCAATSLISPASRFATLTTSSSGNRKRTSPVC